MKWRALATDFDGTIATDGVVDEPTLQALAQLRAGGISPILVTGRELKDFNTQENFLHLFNEVVVENGASLYTPSTGNIQSLATPPSPEFIAELQRLGVTPLSVGNTIVATCEPYETTVLEVIKQMGLELQVIFNKGAVMILPSGVNKASGLAAALALHGIPAEDTVGVGDGENDHALLDFCGFPVAVANAVEALKERAHYITQHSAGAGVTELIEAILEGRFEPKKNEALS